MSKPDWQREGRDWPNRDASRFVVAGGLRWHVQIMGHGPGLLLLHGTGAATHSWRALMPALARHFTVVAPDLPGHGFSAMPNSRGMTLPAISGALAALLDALGIVPLMLVGHSAGAAIALQLNHRLDARAICSMNGALLPFPGAAARLFPALARVLFVNPLVPRLFALQASVSDETGRFLLRSTGSRIDAAGLAFYGRLFRSSGHCAAALAMMANWDLETFARDLRSVTVPLTLIYGEADRTIPPDVAQRVAAMVESAKLVALPGLGHLAHEESPENVAAIIVCAARQAAILPAGSQETSA